jgi:hypothetical protein
MATVPRVREWATATPLENNDATWYTISNGIFQIEPKESTGIPNGGLGRVDNTGRALVVRADI